MKTTVNQRVKLLRDTLALTQPAFSLGADVSSTYISKIENGHEVHSPTINKIIVAYNVNRSWLLEGKGQMFASGTLEENLNRVRSNNINNASTKSVEAPYRDVALQAKDETINELKAETVTLREQVKMMMQTIVNLTSKQNNGPVAANFKKVPDVAKAKVVQLWKSVAYSGAKVANI